MAMSHKYSCSAPEEKISQLDLLLLPDTSELGTLNQNWPSKNISTGHILNKAAIFLVEDSDNVNVDNLNKVVPNTPSLYCDSYFLLSAPSVNDTTNEHNSDGKSYGEGDVDGCGLLVLKMNKNRACTLM